MNDFILADIIISALVSLAALGALKLFKHMETGRALKISVVIFLLSTTILGIVLWWLSLGREPEVRAMYGIETSLDTSLRIRLSACQTQCEQIADKASEAFQSCINACMKK